MCDFIYEHLDENLSVDRLSQVVHFSRYHFHRQFSEYTGVSVIRFIQLMRLKRASYQLAFNKQRKIIEIALDACFENPESFSRAFKNTFGQTPSQFRMQPKWELWQETYHFSNNERTQTMDVKVVIFNETKVAALEHRSSPDTVLDSAVKFIEWRKQSKLSPKDSSDTFGIAYDDPKTTLPENFRFDICGTVSTDVPVNPQGVITKTIPRGRCAVARHLGSHDNIATTVHYLYGEWLPDSGEELRDYPCFFHYLNLIPDVSEHETITDVYLPLK
ncbi:MAG: AraC family transcriptional regulator [Gammaproteobacteria bacterium]|nr:AraC family transcriptional regulator [Gammaproteobacteria bacterium]